MASSRAHRMLAQLVKYATAGAIGTALQYSILLALVEGAGIGAVPASTFGAAAGAVVNYALNHRYTFRSNRPHAEALVKYFCVSIAGIVLNALVLAVAISLVGVHYVIAQVIATGVVLFAAFAVNRAWTF